MKPLYIPYYSERTWQLIFLNVLHRTLPDDDRFQRRFLAHRDSWYPGDYWIKSPDIPHIKICMYHNTNGKNGEILREELLVIIAAIASRMESERLKDHLVIPVCP